MAFEWFRSWHGAPTDSKFRVIAKRAGVAPGVVSAVYWALLDYASQNEPRGSVEGFDVETYAEWAGWEESDVLAILDAFTGKQAIIDGRIAAWEKRQPKKEDDSTERVRAFRERQRIAELQALQALQDASVTQGNDMKHDVTLDKIRQDTEEKRQEQEEEVSPTAAPPKPPRTVTPGSQSDMFGAIAETCQLDAKLKAGQIAKQSKALLEAGYSPAQVRAFPVWWQLHDWRGQRGNVPTLAQLAELIKQSTTSNGTDPVKVPQRGAWSNADRQSEEYKRKMDALIGD